MSKSIFFYKIKVVNNISNAVYFHGKVPYEHVEMLKLNPNLKIDILGRYRENANEIIKDKEEFSGSIDG